jgi:hypothetical protein
MSKVNELFQQSGRPNQGDNRNYFVKALNKVIEDGFITIKIQQKGKIWTNPKHVAIDGSLKKFNIEISGYGWINRSYRNIFSAEELLIIVGDFIQTPEVSEAHIKSLSVNAYEVCKCERCYGKGIIPAFHYYCNGICFQCYGSKYQIVKKKLTV